MNKVLLLGLASLVTLSAFQPSYAADSKMKNMTDKTKAAVMWGPKKVWNGTKWVGTKMNNGMKKMMGK